MQGKRPLELAGWLSAALALFHVVVVFFGAPAYRYFGAGEEIARQAEAGSFFPAALTLAVAAVFVVFALYAFSGAGAIRRLPLLRLGLLAISAMYLLRGLLLLPQLVAFFHHAGLVPPRALAFSSVSLTIGLVYLAGTLRSWPRLGPTPALGSG